MNCNEVRPLLSALFDGELEPPDVLRAHLRSCSECQEVRAELARARSLLAKGGGASAPDSLWPRIAESAARRRQAVRWSLRHVAAALVGALLYAGAFQVLDFRLHGVPSEVPAREGATQAAALLGDLHRRLATGDLGGGEQGLDGADELRLLREILQNRQDHANRESGR